MPDFGTINDVPLIESSYACELLRKRFPQHAETITSLHEDGFAVVDMSFSPEHLKGAAQFCAAVPAGETRCQDGWMRNTSIKALATHDPLIDLLSELYGRRAFPFQTLNFTFGSQQAAHSDTYHFNSLPHGFMCGVWIALEDVHPGAGPLFYYPGSHRSPILERMDLTGVRDYRDYEQKIEELAKRAGYESKEAILKKGQALIWTANLVHGGAPRKNAALTRYSQVTHYYFDDCAYYSPRSFDLEQQQHYIREPFDIATGRFVKSDTSLLKGKPPLRDRLYARRQVLKAKVRNSVMSGARLRK